MNLTFPTDYESIRQRIESIDPDQYGRTRNYVDGAVTYLSPYISRGVISTKQVLQSVLAKGYSLRTVEPLVKELCWRDYFQRVAQVKDISIAIKQEQQPVFHYDLPTSVLTARTGIEGLDKAIEQLYTTGYMHNHCRMYTASVVCNIAKSHWSGPARWMYYHLLDGDWASNACSWQWVAGANSNKKYYANQENINKHTHTHQTNTFLDTTYEALEQMITPPNSLRETAGVAYSTELHSGKLLELQSDLPTFIYNYHNLDPMWHRGEKGNRILLLEPAFFDTYPVSQKCIDFMLALAKNIPNIHVYVGSFESLGLNAINTYYKEHPLNQGYRGLEEPRDWIVKEVEGYYPSFFVYWKNIQSYLPR